MPITARNQFNSQKTNSAQGSSNKSASFGRMKMTALELAGFNGNNASVSVRKPQFGAGRQNGAAGQVNLKNFLG